LGLIDPDVNGGSGENVGSLAGHLYSNVIVSNCYVEGVSVSGDGSFVGGLVGWSTGTIENCYSSTSVFANGVNGTHIGGLVGLNGTGIQSMYDRLVVNCYSTGSVSANCDYVGGLVGGNGCDSIIRNCYSTVNVVGDDYVGGLSGENRGKIKNCFATGDVSGSAGVGGLVGVCFGHDPELLNSYSTGNVTGDSWRGGLVGGFLGSAKNCYSSGIVSDGPFSGGFIGFLEAGSFDKCFWDSDINPGMNGIGNLTDPNVIGKSTAEMQTESTFTSAGWDFVGETVNGANDIWTINDGNDYPIHVWPLINFVGWYEVNLKDYAFFARCWSDNLLCSSADLINNGFIDLEDFAYFADYWLLTGCGTCGGSDLTGDGDVNTPDLLKFTDCWLKTNCQQADFDFSGSIDNKDLDIFTNHWLTGLQ